MRERICRKCGALEMEVPFNKREPLCHSCINARQRAYRVKNLEWHRARGRESGARTRERLRNQERPPVTAERIRELLEYDPETGLFRWKNPSSWQAKGWFRGNKSVRNYRRLWIEGEHIMAHVVAWAIVNGELPEQGIDHRDRDQSNNKWSNLRKATQSQNMKNLGICKRNRTGVRGVNVFSPTRYRAYITADGKRMHLGLFKTIEEASAIRKAAEKKFYGEWAS